MNKVISDKPLLGALFLYLASILYMLLTALSYTDNLFTYTLDDAYIHMSIAKNFTLHHVWGVTQYQFSSSSSSILWTILLSSTYLLFGVNTLAPFLMNIVFSIATIFFLNFLLKNYRCPPLYCFGVLTLVIFIMPLPSLTFSGMEHILHFLLLLVFMYFASLFLSDEENDTSKSQLAGLLISGILLCSVRYEGIFTAFVACILLLLRHRIALSFVLGSLSLLPVILFGLISYAIDASLIPTTSQKVGFPSLHKMHWYRGDEVLIPFALLLLSLVCYIQRLNHYTPWQRTQIWLALFIGTAFLHIIFALFGWFYRYEAYLVGCGVFLLTSSCYELFKTFDEPFPHRTPKIFAFVILLLALAPQVIERTQGSFRRTPRASRNIYQQQYQMSQFVHAYYPTDSIACNDIGAICYFNDHIRIVDLVGLGDATVYRAKRAGKFGTDFMDHLVKDVQVPVIMIYDSWFSAKGQLPPSEWIKVGEWKIPDNVVAGSDVVSFYAPTQDKVEKLKQNLQQFISNLPKEVQQIGI